MRNNLCLRHPILNLRMILNLVFNPGLNIITVYAVIESKFSLPPNNIRIYFISSAKVKEMSFKDVFTNKTLLNSVFNCLAVSYRVHFKINRNTWFAHVSTVHLRLTLNILQSEL